MTRGHLIPIVPIAPNIRTEPLLWRRLPLALVFGTANIGTEPRAMPRRFPPPWSVDELEKSYVIRDSTGQALAYVYFDSETRAVALSWAD
jgi:hypothetical protein